MQNKGFYSPQLLLVAMEALQVWAGTPQPDAVPGMRFTEPVRRILLKPLSCMYSDMVKHR